MRAITILQPYAHLIVTGEKRVENRKWLTTYRGPIAIHAGKSHEWLEGDEVETDMAFGAIVGTATLVDCIEIERIRLCELAIVNRFPWITQHEHAEGPFCFVLENVRRCVPIPFKGAQGLFFVPDSVLS